MGYLDSEEYQKIGELISEENCPGYNDRNDDVFMREKASESILRGIRNTVRNSAFR